MKANNINVALHWPSASPIPGHEALDPRPAPLELDRNRL
jgi:hypothetical protein